MALLGGGMVTLKFPDKHRQCLSIVGVIVKQLGMMVATSAVCRELFLLWIEGFVSGKIELQPLTGHNGLTPEKNI